MKVLEIVKLDNPQPSPKGKVQRLEESDTCHFFPRALTLHYFDKIYVYIRKA